MYIYYLKVVYKKKLCPFICIDSVIMTISSNVSKSKCLTKAKNKKGVFSLQYKAGICQKFWYVVGI